MLLTPQRDPRLLPSNYNGLNFSVHKIQENLSPFSFSAPIIVKEAAKETFRSFQRGVYANAGSDH